MASHRYPNIASIINVDCQPYRRPRNATNGGTMIAPNAAPLLKMPEAVERSCGGNHSLVMRTAAGQLPASPIPKRNRQIPNCNGVTAKAWIRPAVVQKAIHNE